MMPEHIFNSHITKRVQGSGFQGYTNVIQIRFITSHEQGSGFGVSGLYTSYTYAYHDEEETDLGKLDFLYGGHFLLL